MDSREGISKPTTSIQYLTFTFSGWPFRRRCADPPRPSSPPEHRNSQARSRKGTRPRPSYPQYLYSCVSLVILQHFYPSSVRNLSAASLRFRVPEQTRATCNRRGRRSDAAAKFAGRSSAGRSSTTQIAPPLHQFNTTPQRVRRLVSAAERVSCSRLPDRISHNLTAWTVLPCSPSSTGTCTFPLKQRGKSAVK